MIYAILGCLYAITYAIISGAMYEMLMEHHHNISKNNSRSTGVTHAKIARKVRKVGIGMAICLFLGSMMGGFAVWDDLRDAYDNFDIFLLIITLTLECLMIIMFFVFYRPKRKERNAATVTKAKKSSMNPLGSSSLDSHALELAEGKSQSAINGD